MDRITQKKHDVANAVYEFFDAMRMIQDRLAKVELENFANQARIEEARDKISSLQAKIVFLEEKITNLL